VLLGRGSAGTGDGTFAAPVRYAAGSDPWDLVVGDFNEDGISDLAVTDKPAFAKIASQAKASLSH